MSTHFVYAVVLYEDGDCPSSMGSIEAMSTSGAIHKVWHDILQFEHEDDDFNGCVMLYDTEERRRVYYYRG
jgi:hypothetical protein